MNQQQQSAIAYLSGPCLVLAGAGSGKTRVITHKISWLIKECAYDARRVVALTFTNKAAREMSQRLKALIDTRLTKGLTVSTFHSFGLRFLREEARHIGLKSNFSVLDANDSLAIIQEHLETTDKARLRAVQQAISLWKNALIDVDQAEAQAHNPSDLESARIYRHYSATLEAYQAVDFDDLIRLPTLLLQENASVRKRWQARIHYLLIDEYQDTNACQYELMRLLVGDRAMFTAVGDDDQAIYAWRGATVENLKRLAVDYPDLKLIKLEQNYRSVQRILSAANRLIGNNTSHYGKRLWSDLGVGEAIQVTPMASDRAEAESIAIRLSAARFERQAQWRDFAVLYRGNHQARIVEQALRELRIPYSVSGGQSFFDRPEIRDILAYFRLLANTQDDAAFIRAATTPRRGIGQRSLEVLGRYANEQGASLFEAATTIVQHDLLPVRQYDALSRFIAFIQRYQKKFLGSASETVSAQLTMTLDGAPTDDPAVAAEQPADAITALVREIRYEAWLFDSLDEKPAERRWQNVCELIEWLQYKVKQEDLSLEMLLQHIALMSMLERADDDDPNTVRLSTIHAAKGLEYPHVYLIGVEEDLLPHTGRLEETFTEEEAALAHAHRIQEERRLMYVAITRAQRSMHISWCRTRRRARELVACEPSRFIAEMGLVPAPDTAEVDAQGLSPKQRLSKLRALLQQ